MSTIDKFVEDAYEDFKDHLDDSIEKFIDWNTQANDILQTDDGLDEIDGFIGKLFAKYLKERK
jgi:hypothetical protein